MRLTKHEADIVRHRLEVPDAIEDFLTDREENAPPYEFTGDEIYDAVNDLFHGLPELPDNPTPLQADIIEDCLAGSVYYQAAKSAADEEMGCSRGEFLNIARAAGTLEEKISKLLGREVECVRH